jgi:hypothetical protein
MEEGIVMMKNPVVAFRIRFFLYIQLNAPLHYIKMLLHVSVNEPSSGSVLPCFAKVMIIKIVS